MWGVDLGGGNRFTRRENPRDELQALVQHHEVKGNKAFQELKEQHEQELRDARNETITGQANNGLQQRNDLLQNENKRLKDKISRLQEQLVDREELYNRVPLLGTIYSSTSNAHT